MGVVLVPSLQVKASTRIRRRRELPIRGFLAVELGAQVNEDKVVATAHLPSEMRIVRVAEELGVEPHEAVQAIVVKEGDTVRQGDTLAERRTFFGLFRSKVVAKFSGTVELVSRETAHVALRAPPLPLELNAYLRGRVVEIEPERAVTIESRVSFVQGIFGIGGERSGKIRILDIPPREILSVSHLESARSGDILVGGCCPSSEFLHAAAARGVAALVVGSLDDKALSQYLGYELGIALTGDEKVPLTVIMTEGFGVLPIAEHTMKLLRECNGMSASVNGATQVRAGAIRPEIIVFREDLSDNDTVEKPVEMAVGVRVRVIRVPYFGQYGEITDLPKQLVKLDTGGEARVLTVRLDSGDTVTVPRANIELVS
jgi:hypothetical protein